MKKLLSATTVITFLISVFFLTLTFLGIFSLWNCLTDFAELFFHYLNFGFYIKIFNPLADSDVPFLNFWERLLRNLITSGVFSLAFSLFSTLIFSMLLVGWNALVRRFPGAACILLLPLRVKIIIFALIFSLNWLGLEIQDTLSATQGEMVKAFRDLHPNPFTQESLINYGEEGSTEVFSAQIMLDLVYAILDAVIAGIIFLFYYQKISAAIGKIQHKGAG